MIVQTADRINRINEYFFSQKLNQIRKMRDAGQNIINLGIGNPDLAPSDGVLKKAMESISLSSSHGYQPYRSIAELRRSFSDWYKRIFRVKLNPDDEVLPLMGSKEGIMHVSLAFLNRADGVLIPDPGYPAYEAAARVCDARILHYNLLEKNTWLPDLEELRRHDLTGVKLMWINYPNMPTGVRASDNILKNLIDFGKENNILIVNDNPYSLILNPEPKSLLAYDPEMECSMELNSLSKSYNMAGWRIGMIGGSAQNINSVLKVKSNIDSGMFLPVQVAAIEALKTGDDWIYNLNNIYKRRREIVYRLLDILGSEYVKDQSGLFVWSHLPKGNTSSFEYSDMLLKEYGIFITPGAVFGSNGRKYIRTSLCVSEELLEESIERMKSN